MLLLILILLLFNYIIEVILFICVYEFVNVIFIF